MGVDLGDLFKKEKISFGDLHDRVIVIDAHNVLHQFLSSIRQRDGTPLKDSKGRVTSHLSGLLHRTANIVEARIRPVYVFDGEAEISISKQAHLVKKGEMIIMPANEPHALQAKEKFKMLLVMIKA